MELLLLSNSTLPGTPFFEWPKTHVQEFVKGRERVAFVPYAAVEEQRDNYAEKVVPIFGEFGVELFSLHHEKNPISALDNADAVVIGGGNSFLLLQTLYRTGLLKAIGNRVKNGLPYFGWSAGSNVACPSIMTTNDMPIVEPPSMRALHLVPFQINPHYTEATIPGHGGESRDQRIAEYLATNPKSTVAGLREGSLLHVKNGQCTLVGKDMKVFNAGKDPEIIAAGSVTHMDLRLVEG